MKDKCQVCGCSDVEEYEDLDGGRNSRLVCGGSHYLGCMHAERLAIARAAEIERLKAALAKSVELWPAALVKADELAEENARLKAALQRIADQGPHYGPDGTLNTWKHWRDIASETLTETKPQETST